MTLGFHAHNNMNLALGNAVAALSAGCTYIDASIAGLGKGAGHVKLEELMSYLYVEGHVEKLALLSAWHAKNDVESLGYIDKDSHATYLVMGLLNLPYSYAKKLTPSQDFDVLFEKALSCCHEFYPQ